MFGSDVGIVVTSDDVGDSEAGGIENGGFVWVVELDGAADGLPSTPRTAKKAKYNVSNLIVVLQTDQWCALGVLMYYRL